MKLMITKKQGRWFATLIQAGSVVCQFENYNRLDDLFKALQMQVSSEEQRSGGR